MSTWATVLTASALCYAAKLGGYLVPGHVLERPPVARASALLPVALLAALVAVQTLGGASGALLVDARVVALGVAAVALVLRAPFLVVVVLAAATAAGLRALG